MKKLLAVLVFLSFIETNMAEAATNVGPYYGVWNATTTYPIGSLITENNQTYIAVISSKNKAVSTNPDKWKLLSSVIVGLKGDTGAQGIQGVAGPIGPQGIQGVAGPIGPEGIQGLKGDTGPQGIQGVAGPIGPEGIQGLKGDTGPQGIQGVAGPRGPAGLPQAGNNTGDMQYWDGTQWQLIPPPNPLPVAPAKATLSFCNGAPTWAENCLPINTTVYNVGDTGPAGGKVFFLTDNTGLHGLEAAPVDQSAGASWGCTGTSISGARGTWIGTGAANTVAIVNGCNEANTAAKLADAYTLNGYSDWFLPSRDELSLLYAQNYVVGGFANNIFYWSSSEYGSNHAWVQDLVGGSGGGGFKANTYPVRAVRAF